MPTSQGEGRAVEGDNRVLLGRREAALAGHHICGSCLAVERSPFGGFFLTTTDHVANVGTVSTPGHNAQEVLRC